MSRERKTSQTSRIAIPRRSLLKGFGAAGLSACAPQTGSDKKPIVPGSIELEGELISGEIHMRGEDGFEGLVRIVASLPVAQAAARVMFTTDTPDDRDATDTIAELINMIGAVLVS